MYTMSPVAEIATCALLLVGSVFTLVGAIGLVRLPDFFMRLHGPTKSTTLGVGGVVVASVVFFSNQGDGLSLHELLITAFLFLTAPISAHMLAKAAMQQRLPVDPRTRGHLWDAQDRERSEAPAQGGAPASPRNAQEN
ncbi:putative monovalent cation/H+ antiporter subunit G [Cupriavidus basilensis OR16]|uniref:Putative monovalent cation/H+ antiporter subunit G n=2 Tax=Cupriavidus basilensis TaxID=68895 RepID=H1RZ11_9BURK|nr:putative monovalent cation/H+ antiporter subunit G [Cupriavidus basilensis OR16]